jgi:hypothetical protein
VAVFGRDRVQIGLAENGGDPSQEGCFFEVDDVEAAFDELRSNGLDREDAGYRHAAAVGRDASSLTHIC